jgi:hypothetical protein
MSGRTTRWGVPVIAGRGRGKKRTCQSLQAEVQDKRCHIYEHGIRSDPRILNLTEWDVWGAQELRVYQLPASAG